ncbi:MAG: SDR family NAD(P)-dependent oxidoreductase [Actinomycetota bacterium]|nr:SDR family NAD(P)-dependent oxidoreductase [Actinomycetota bacterium]
MSDPPADSVGNPSVGHAGNPSATHPADLSGVRCVVTGATSGLGAAMADALLAAGATVAFASRPGPRLDDAVAARSSRGLRAVALPVDVRDPVSVASAADDAIARLDGIDLLVNNAGIGMRTVNPRFFDHPMPFFDVTPERFSDVVATNLTGYFLVARAFAPHMAQRHRGRIVNVSINHQTMSRQGFVPYGPSRAGSESLSRIMTEDLRPFGVTVAVLLPGGATDTGMIPESLPDEARHALLRPEIMGPPIVFLASSEADGLTGTRIVASEFDRWLAEFRSGRTG